MSVLMNLSPLHEDSLYDTKSLHGAQSEPEIPQWILDYGYNIIKEFNIDESHGMQHGIDVLNYAKVIVQRYLDDNPNIIFIENMPNKDAEMIIYVSALVHDWIDKKYMREDLACQRMEAHFSSHEFKYIKEVLIIITNISYSKRLVRRKQGLPMIDTGYLQLATEIVADADMLDAYKADRCLIYQRRFQHHTVLDPIQAEAWPNEVNTDNEYDIRRIAKNILVNRVLLYRDHFMNTIHGKEMSKPLHDELETYINIHMSDII